MNNKSIKILSLKYSTLFGFCQKYGLTRFRWGCILLLSLSLSTCKDQPEQIPAYLKIEPFTVDANGGTAWHKFIYGWVYVNGEFLGAYSPGGLMPVLAEGEAKVQVYPGVNTNGIAETPDLYPMMTKWEGTVNLIPGEIVPVNPTTRYESVVRFVWGERATFDANTIVFDNVDEDAQINLTFDADEGFAGRSARMTVDKNSPLMIIATEWVEGLPTTGDREVWLEMHYKNDVPFQLYLSGTGGSVSDTNQPVFQFQPKSEWNKIYFNLTTAISRSNSRDFRLGFRVDLPRKTDGTFSQDQATVRIDNLQLVHF